MKKLLIVCTALLCASWASAQRPERPDRPAGDGSRPGGAMRMREPESLFPPGLLREHADELKLSDEQRAALKAEAEKAEGQTSEARKKVREQMEALGTLLKADKVDEAAALAQLDKVLDAEREVRKAQMASLIRLKNILTPEQQAQLRELRQKMGERSRPSRPEGKGEGRPSAPKE